MRQLQPTPPESGIKLILTLTRSLFFIKFIHTLIFVFFSLCIAVVVFSAITGQISGLTWWALVLVLIEAVVFFGNDWRCPLTNYAEKLGADNGSVADIFLPIWFAKRLPVIAGTIFGLAALVVVFRALS